MVLPKRAYAICYRYTSRGHSQPTNTKVYWELLRCAAISNAFPPAIIEPSVFICRIRNQVWRGRSVVCATLFHESQRYQSQLQGRGHSRGSLDFRRLRIRVPAGITPTPDRRHIDSDSAAQRSSILNNGPAGPGPEVLEASPVSLPTGLALSRGPYSHGSRLVLYVLSVAKRRSLGTSIAVACKHNDAPSACVEHFFLLVKCERSAPSTKWHSLREAGCRAASRLALRLNVCVACSGRALQQCRSPATSV